MLAPTPQHPKYLPQPSCLAPKGSLSHCFCSQPNNPPSLLTSLNFFVISHCKLFVFYFDRFTHLIGFKLRFSYMHLITSGTYVEFQSEVLYASAHSGHECPVIVMGFHSSFYMVVFQGWSDYTTSSFLVYFIYLFFFNSTHNYLLHCRLFSILHQLRTIHTVSVVSRDFQQSFLSIRNTIIV